MLAAKLDRAAVTGGKQIVFVEVSAIPHRPDGMDHMPGLQPISLGDLGVASLATVQHAALGNELGPRGAMDRAIDAPASEQRRVRGVDDGVNAQCRDVGNNDLEPRGTNLARGQ